jgi:hypothetical protein
MMRACPWLEEVGDRGHHAREHDASEQALHSAEREEFRHVLRLAAER